jgi:hypothetical protein
MRLWGRLLFVFSGLMLAGALGVWIYANHHCRIWNWENLPDPREGTNSVVRNNSRVYRQQLIDFYLPLRSAAFAVIICAASGGVAGAALWRAGRESVTQTGSKALESD